MSTTIQDITEYEVYLIDLNVILDTEQCKSHKNK